MMEYDPATSDQGILESSYEEVDRAHAYLVLISNWRYGRILDVADNPQNWSVTELEFRRAEAPNKTKLDAFRTHTSHHNRITADEAVDTAEGSLGRAPRDCIRPDDADLLLQLVAAGPSKILITSRPMPLGLTNGTGGLPGVRHELLTGLDQPDAAAMLTGAGIKGDLESMGRSSISSSVATRWWWGSSPAWSRTGCRRRGISTAG